MAQGISRANVYNGDRVWDWNWNDDDTEEFMPNSDDTHEYELDDEPEPIEAYCVRDRETVIMEDPTPVWTRKGMPATRGECPICGGVVFRLGKTDAHARLTRPDAVDVSGQDGRTRAKLTPDTVYVAFAEGDTEIAEQIASDLERSGLPAWLHELEPDNVNWAGGVHPSLKGCKRLVLVLSPDGLADTSVEDAWRFFRDKRKPIVIAQIAPAEPPDLIRRSPRFDLSSDYKTAFRQMVQALSE